MEAVWDGSGGSVVGVCGVRVCRRFMCRVVLHEVSSAANNSRTTRVDRQLPLMDE